MEHKLSYLKHLLPEMAQEDVLPEMAQEDVLNKSLTFRLLFGFGFSVIAP